MELRAVLFMTSMTSRKPRSRSTFGLQLDSDDDSDSDSSSYSDSGPSSPTESISSFASSDSFCYVSEADLPRLPT